LVHNTVDRLDRPSAYYLAKVRLQTAFGFDHFLIKSFEWQNKKRKYSQDDSERPEDPVDKLKDATTIYVGNLYVGL
jgi:nuclear cap-binding protein subunit 2